MEIDGPSDATLLVLCAFPPEERVRSALAASAQRLGHKLSPAFAVTEHASPAALRLLVFERDPWAVVALDDASIGLLRAAFADEAGGFGPDAPVEACGYTLVAVPCFANCFESQELKRVSWGRLKAAEHPALL
ncbi:MAG: hypothetical protein ACI36W_06225 [Coriobacteriales bacterium]